MADDLGSRSLFLTVLEAGLIILFNTLSLLGNVLVCISVYRNTWLCTTTNIYIIALAVTDLLSAIFVMPFVTSVLITGGWPFGKTICQMHAFFSLFVVYLSPVTMGLTALNRYVKYASHIISIGGYFRTKVLASCSRLHGHSLRYTSW